MAYPGYDDRTITIRPNYEAFVVGLVLLSLINSFLIFLVQNREQRNVIFIVQALICAFLLVDALYRLRWAHVHRPFLPYAYNWLYFVGSLPIPFIYVMRLVPIWIMVRRLRRTDYEALGRVVIRKRAQSTLLSVILVAIVVLEGGSILVLGAEWHASGANIKTASDALWWSIVTIATVGYGDRYPTTNGGRIIGIFVMVVGVAVFTSMSSFLAQWFIRQRSAPEDNAAVSVLTQPAPEDNQQPAEDAIAPVTWEQLRTLLDAREEAHLREVQDLRTRLAAFEATQPSNRSQPPGGGADSGTTGSN
jgi:hypothetical protein